MEALMALRDIRYRRGGFTLRVDRLDLCPGGLYFLLGPNGAGKSTLLQILALLGPPDAGTIDFAGQRLRWQPRLLQQARSAITLVHQSPYLFDRSVYQNVAFGLQLRGVRGRPQQTEVASALDAVGLAEFEKRRARELSGGETQRVALARALALRPRLLLLDEPTAGIHRETLPVIEGLLEDLRQAGTTVVVATHDPEQPRRLRGEVLHLENGQLVGEVPVVERQAQVNLPGPGNLRRLVLAALGRPG